jgi:hypothetical protein
MPRLCTEFYVKRAHSQCVEVIDIRKIASAEDDSLERDVPSTSSEMDAPGLHEVQYFEDPRMG